MNTLMAMDLAYEENLDLADAQDAILKAQFALERPRIDAILDDPYGAYEASAA